MGNPFVYVELHSTDTKRAQDFYGAMFDWDDASAAHKHRLEQARLILRSLQIINPDASSEPWAVYDHNPERAAALLETACEELERDCEANPPKLIFSTTSNGDIRVRWANLLEDMLAKSGIEVELQMEDSQLYFGETLDDGTWDLGLWAWLAQVMSSFYLLHTAQMAPSLQKRLLFGGAFFIIIVFLFRVPNKCCCMAP